MGRAGFLGVSAAAGLALCAGCHGLRPGVTAPDFTLTSLDDRQVSLSDFRGQVVLLSYWASW